MGSNLDEKIMHTLLNQGEYGILSLVLDDGQPYGVPISYVYHEDGPQLYFRTALKGEKVSGLKEGAEASFAIVSPTKHLDQQLDFAFASVLARGTIHIVEDKDEKVQVLNRIVNKYAKAEEPEVNADALAETADNTLIFAIKVDSISGKQRG